MKRSQGPRSPGTGRFEKSHKSSPQMQLHQQYHQHHMQQQHNMAMAAAMSNPPYYAGGGGGRPAGMMPYGRGPPTVGGGPYSMYNHGYGGGMPPRMWNCNLNVPPPPIRAPMLLPPHHLNTSLPPPPIVPESERANNNNNARNRAAAKEEEEYHTVVNKKAKRKSMSARYGCSKDWIREDALKALALEEEYSNRTTNAPILLLRFPDPDLSREIVGKYSSAIESVHFQQNSAPRYCFVHLKEDADVEETIATISKIPFGTGYVSAEQKRVLPNTPVSSIPDEVDPYTLYIGNLPTTISSRTVKEHFPGAHRIDIGFAQRMKYTRYAFVRYDSVEEAVEGFKRSVNTLIESRSLVVRFRRQRSTIAFSEPPARKDATAIINVDADKEKDAQTADLAAAPSSSRACVPIAQGTSSPAPVSPIEQHFGTAFDSPNSLEEPDNIEGDSKEHVFDEAQKLQQKLQQEQQTARTKRSSLDELFGELERRDSRLANIGLSHPSGAQPGTTDAPVKTELNSSDEQLSEEEDMSVPNLLGLRYNGDTHIKREPSEEELPINQIQRDEVYREEFDYDEEFASEPEEDDVAHWRGPSVLSNGALRANSLDTLRQQELSASERKPTVSQLLLSSTNHTSRAALNEHASFMKKLYEQNRRIQQAEGLNRPRDEMDDMFAQLNSDSENEDDWF